MVIQYVIPITHKYSILEETTVLTYLQTGAPNILLNKSALLVFSRLEFMIARIIYDPLNNFQKVECISTQCNEKSVFEAIRAGLISVGFEAQ